MDRVDRRKFGANLHILDEKTIKDFEEKYDVHLEGKYIIFALTYQKYVRCYEVGEKFNVMTNDKTKLTIQPMAVDYWKDHREHSLFRVQNEINKLIIFNQEPTTENITKQLSNN